MLNPCRNAECPSNCDVVLAGDGAEDAKQAFDRKFDVIFMDLSIPNMNGWDAARLIRSRNGAKSRYTPIYALTAHALPEEQKALLEAGMDGCILKPLRSRNLNEVLSNIRTSLDRKTEGGTTSVNAAENVVDRSVVDELRDVLGPTMFENKLNDFLREMELVGKQLREKAKSESWEDLAKLAHKFAGSASVFRASGLKDKLQVLETNAKMKSTQTIASDVQDIVRLCKSTAKDMSSYRHGPDVMS